MSTQREILNRFLEAQDRLVFQASDLSLGTIANMVTREAIDISPVFQRRERWSTQKQSALIESFLINVPVPPIYLAEDEFGRYSVVDGKQRITAIHRFLNDDLTLKELETFKEIEGLRYSDLPHDLRNALEVRPYLRVVTLLKQSDPTLKFEVFTRLNRGGESMAAQELRNVAFRGPLNDLIYGLASNEFLRRQLKIKDERSASYQIMADAEYVLRFFTLDETWKRFSGDYRAEMDRYMARHREPPSAQLRRMADKFNRAISACEEIWGEHAFQRPVGGGWRDQMLAGMYDAEMIAVAQLTDEALRNAIDNAAEVIDGTRQLFEDGQFDTAVRLGTNTPGRVVYRIDRVTDLMLHVGGRG